MNIEQIVTDYGYWAVLLGSFLEGETIVLVAGFAAFRDYLSLPVVMTIAFFGSFFADQILFYIGRYKGMSVLKRCSRWQDKIDRVFTMMHRKQNLVIFGFRFVYGFRTITPILLGASHKINPLRYLLINALGALVWSVSLAGLGYVMGQTIMLLMHDIQHVVKAFIVIVIAGLMGLWLFRRYRERGVHEVH